MFFAVIVLVFPLCVQGKLTEVRKCFNTNSAGIKIADGQCGNLLEDSVCAEIFETPINDGFTNAQVDQKCYDDECLSGGCLKQCLLCCEECENDASEMSCGMLKACGGCTRDDLKSVMINNCPKMCGFCRLRNQTTTTSTTTTTTTTSTTTTSTSTTTTTKRPSTPCPTGWSRCEGCKMCYLSDMQQRSFSQSLTYCNQMGGFLASPKSEAENDFITSMYPSGTVYLGIRRRDDPRWTAASGLDQGYFNWNTNQPSGNNKCILLDFPHGMWRSYDCNGGAGFTCEVNETNASSPCDAGWRHCAECHLCYLVVTIGLTVDRGIAYCQERNSLMSSPQSKIENDFIKALYGGGYHYLGTKYELNTKWISSADVEVNYSKWQANHPIEGNECVLFNFANGQWQSSTCIGATGAVCEVEEGEYYAK